MSPPHASGRFLPGEITVKVETPAAQRGRQCRGRRASRPVGRVLCTRLRGPTAIHLGLPLPAASCGLPASIGRAALNRSRRPCDRSRKALLTLLQVGFTKPPQSPAALVVSYTTVSPLPLARPKTGPGAVCFLWHCPAGHPGSALPTTLPCGARTFLTGFPRRGRPADSPAAASSIGAGRVSWVDAAARQRWRPTSSAHSRR